MTEVTLTQTAEIFRLNELVMQMDHELQQGNTEGGANLSHQLERLMSLKMIIRVHVYNGDEMSHK